LDYFPRRAAHDSDVIPMETVATYASAWNFLSRLFSAMAGLAPLYFWQ
tara:strand:+ start:781 stop:924 length:144 start_codon:yes stop_codon:yes gene_type:complete